METKKDPLQLGLFIILLELVFDVFWIKDIVVCPHISDKITLGGCVDCVTGDVIYVVEEELCNTIDTKSSVFITININHEGGWSFHTFGGDTR